jgi:hypothetical protein
MTPVAISPASGPMYRRASPDWFDRYARNPGYNGNTQTPVSGVARPRANEPNS